MTPGLVGFSGNSWNRHDEKKDEVKVTEMKIKDNAKAGILIKYWVGAQIKNKICPIIKETKESVID